MLLAVDPGNVTGVACFVNGLLCFAEAMKSRAFMSWIKRPWQSDVCAIVELPQVYRASLSKGDPNDLIKLAVQCGWVQLAIPQTTLITPQQWKGQCPKDVTAARTREALTPQDLQPSSKDHNMWDAIALGMVHLKRVRMR